MSLRATGTPWSGPTKRPSRASMSRCTATRAAASRSRCTQALRVGSRASIRLRQAARRLDGDSAPERMRRAASAAVTSLRSAMASPARRRWLLERVQNFGDDFEAPKGRHEIGTGVAAPKVADELLRRLDSDSQTALPSLAHASADGVGNSDPGYLVMEE